MSAVRRGIQVVRTVWSAVRSMLWEVQRWKSSSVHPTLQIESKDSAYWGRVDLPLTVVNEGGRAAVDCRYCQYRVFSMGSPGDSAPNAVAWYLTDSFTVPAAGRRSVKAYAGEERCARVVMSGLIDGPLDATSYAEALVCRDRFGTLYRFLPAQTGGMETWRATTLDRLMRRQAPAWTAWLDYPPVVETRAWTSVFREPIRQR